MTSFVRRLTALCFVLACIGAIWSSVAAAVPSSQINIVTMGNSNTDFNDAHGTTAKWPTPMLAALQSQDTSHTYTLTNIGTGGTGTCDWLPTWATNHGYVVGDMCEISGTCYRCVKDHTSSADFSQDASADGCWTTETTWGVRRQQLPLAKAGNPDVIVFMIGTNDFGFTMQNYSENLTSIIKEIRTWSAPHNADGKVRLILMEPPIAAPMTSAATKAQAQAGTAIPSGYYSLGRPQRSWTNAELSVIGVEDMADTIDSLGSSWGVPVVQTWHNLASMYSWDGSTNTQCDALAAPDGVHLTAPAQTALGGWAAQAVEDAVSGPPTSISGVPAGWVDHDVTFALSTSAPASLGAVQTYFGLNAAALSLYSSPVTVQAEGTTTISYRSVATLTGAGPTGTAVVQIDKTSPETFDDHATAYTGRATIDLSANDGLSGVATTRWSLDGVPGTGKLVSSSVPGSHTLEYASTDRAGNAETSHTIQFAVTRSVAVTVLKLTGSSSVTTKKRYSLTGTISPASAPGKVKITLQRYSHGWRGAGSATASLTHGRFSYSFKPSVKGQWRIIVSYSGGGAGVTTYLGSKSPAKPLKVK